MASLARHDDEKLDQIAQSDGLIDEARPSDIETARNLRRMEHHRYELSIVLQSLGRNETDLASDIDITNQVSGEISDPAITLGQGPHFEPNYHDVQARSLSEDESKELAQLRIDLINAHASLKTLFWDSHYSTNRRMQSSAYMAKSMLLNYHNKYYDRHLEDILFAPISPASSKSRARLLRNRDLPQPCAPVKLVDWSLQTIADYQRSGDFKNFVFVDPSAGHGRTLLQASKWNFQEVIGYETDCTRHKNARMNIAQFPRSLMTQRNINCFNKDPRLTEWPEKPLFIQLFNPQNRGWLKSIITEIGHSFYKNPRPIYVVLVGLRHLDILAQSSFLNAFKPYISIRTKLSLMSPYSLAFYRALPAEIDEEPHNFG